MGPIGPRTNWSYHSLICTIDHRQTEIVIVVSLTMMPSSPNRSGDRDHQGGGGRDHHGGGVFKPPGGGGGGGGTGDDDIPNGDRGRSPTSSSDHDRDQLGGRRSDRFVSPHDRHRDNRDRGHDDRDLWGGRRSDQSDSPHDVLQKMFELIFQL